jgi:hypothetical protein
VIREARSTDISDIRALMNSVAGLWDTSWRPDVLERALGSADTIALVHQERRRHRWLHLRARSQFPGVSERTRRGTSGAAARDRCTASR